MAINKFNNLLFLCVKAGVGLVIMLLLILLICDGIVVHNASGCTYDKVEDMPEREYGLLLATSPITPGGARNFYFDNRIKSAVELYNAGKVKKIIASGGEYTGQHNGNGCNEPVAIRDSLIARGVPEYDILLDFDGQRTIKSIINLKEKFGVDEVTLISQKYHNERAIYQADHLGIDAIGYNAEPSPIRRNRIKSTIREYFARVKLFIDILLTKPKAEARKDIPFDIYGDCVSRYGDPERKIPLDSLCGVWYGYGHLWDPRRTLTINPDGTYSLLIEEAIRETDEGKMVYTGDSVAAGRYKYEPKFNKITYLDVHDSIYVAQCKSEKYPNPKDEEAIVFSLRNDTLQLFELTCDCWPYLRHKSHQDADQ